MLTLTGGTKLKALLRILGEVDHVPGAVVECGVYQGGTLAALAQAAPTRDVIGFDTFGGLPAEAWSEGEPHAVGDFGDTSLDAVRANLAGLPNVHLRPGLFPQTALGLGPVAFAHVDFDYYESTRAAIEHLLPVMSKGGAIVFDDYGWHRCPGVRRAIDEAGLDVQALRCCQAVYRVPA